MDMQEFNRSVIEEFRANGGKVGGAFAGAQLLLLHTVGAKSGQPRVNPLAYLDDDGRYIIIASYAGAPHNPPWYHNLRAHPDVRVEVGERSIQARAEVVEEPERTRLYARMAQAMPAFDEYRSKTDRAIPVIALTPQD